MSVDSVGDFLSIIRNGLMVSKPFVIAPYSRMRYAISTLLGEEGFVRGIEIIETAPGKKGLKVFLKYVDGESVIHCIKRMSTPGRRAYAGISCIKPVIGGLGLTILSTNKGVITHKKARDLRVGGEILCTVW